MLDRRVLSCSSSLLRHAQGPHPGFWNGVDCTLLVKLQNPYIAEFNLSSFLLDFSFLIIRFCHDFIFLPLEFLRMFELFLDFIYFSFSVFCCIFWLKEIWSTTQELEEGLHQLMDLSQFDPHRHTWHTDPLLSQGACWSAYHFMHF